jgi:hypothetical protein
MKLYDEYQFFVSLNLKKNLMSLLWWCEGVDVHRGIVFFFSLTWVFGPAWAHLD